uniref:Uncharacterized protein n=1 Tax=Arundo donax TaxID=35708 RepID=A0A0A9FLR0_ARUDO
MITIGLVLDSAERTLAVAAIPSAATRERERIRSATSTSTESTSAGSNSASAAMASASAAMSRSPKSTRVAASLLLCWPIVG